MIVISKESVLSIKTKYDILSPILNERAKRIWSATEAISYGQGGVTAVNKATSISRTTIYVGIREIRCIKNNKLNTHRMRISGSGRPSLVSKEINIKKDLEKLVEPYSVGDPESPLRWTSKSVRNLSKELNKKYKISFKSVSTILRSMGYSLQENKKTLGGNDNPDRNLQFKYINNKSKEFLDKNLPVISVDTKKKENIGEYKNEGKEYSLKGNPIEVNTYDFPNKTLGKVSPYGIYDIGQNKGWVSVGISADTAQFAVNAIRSWWYNMGQKLYPNNVPEIYINADGGGSNGHRVRLWKIELQNLANELNKTIHVSHFPPGTSKWNKIEHKMFSYISKNWRGKPLITREVVVNLIANTTTEKGLKIEAILDKNTYEKGITVSDAERDAISITKDKFHGEWNYKISAQK